MRWLAAIFMRLSKMYTASSSQQEADWEELKIYTTIEWAEYAIKHEDAEGVYTVAVVNDKGNLEIEFLPTKDLIQGYLKGVLYSNDRLLALFVTSFPGDDLHSQAKVQEIVMGTPQILAGPTVNEALRSE
jgi:hypothetical protein